MSDVNANVGIHFDTANALAQLRQLQAGLSKFNQSLTEGNVAAANAQKGLNAQLMQAINSTGKFVASQKTIATGTTAFTDALEKNKFSMREYARFTAAAATQNSKVFSNMFAQEKDILNRAAKDRVKALQTQYIQLQNAQGEFVKVLQVVPKHLQTINGEFSDYATRMQMNAQRQQFFNKLIQQGSTNLLNFGKNTQWAGRQLMVGLTIPLTILGSTASKTFTEMEQAITRLSRVYGDMTTSQGATDKAIADIRRLGVEFTKWGVKVVDTVNMAADAAAAGFSGQALIDQVTNATKLAVLGQVSQQDALQTTISLQNAFGISSDQLAKKINFLNAVENQTVLSIEDMTTAIPKAAPVVKQLGGNVEDLAFFLTAMKEGGINASEGANALKSSLASMINPSKKASDMLAGFGISIKGIVDANAGNLKGTVYGIAKALDSIAPLDRARAIETMFGKFQFARVSTLLQNIAKDGTQASKVLGLAGASTAELAILSQRELGKVENMTSTKFAKSMENLKQKLVPLGEAFLKAATPIVNFVSKILERFNNLSDGTKKFVTMFIGIVGGIAPVVLMTFGLVANGVANIIKFFAMLRGGMAKLNGQSNVLGGGFDYLTQAETEQLAQSHALHESHKQLISTFNVEAGSVNQLATAYGNAASQANALAMSSPGLFNIKPGARGAMIPGYADGVYSVPGPKGAGDVVPAMLSPGETVVPVTQSNKHRGLLAAIINDQIPGYSTGNLKAETPAWLNKERTRIAGLDDRELIAYAKRVGLDIADTSKAALEKIRENIASEFDKVVADTQAKFGKITQTGIKEVGKSYDPEKGYSRMGAYYPKYDEKYGASFGHVGQTEKMSGSNPQGIQLVDKAQKQLDIINQYYAKSGRQTPDLRVADAFGFSMKQFINRGMASQDQSGFVKEHGMSVGKAFEQDFAKTGTEKWRTMTNLVGANFDQLQGQIKIYDDALLKKVQSWNADVKNQGQPFTDDIFRSLEEEVRGDIASLIPDFQQVIRQAKQSITAVRISVKDADLPGINADLKAAGAGTIGTEASNAKLLNSEARGKSGVVGQKIGSDLIDGINSSEGIDARSPSRKARKAGKNVALGLEIGMKEGQAQVSMQAKKLGDSAAGGIDKSNLAKYEDMKTDPAMRQTQKSIDRHYRKLYGANSGSVESSSLSASISIPASRLKEALNNAAANKVAEESAKQAAKASHEKAKADKAAASASEMATKASKAAADAAKKDPFAKITHQMNASFDALAIKEEELFNAAKQKMEIALQELKGGKTSAIEDVNTQTQARLKDTRLNKEDALKEASKYINTEKEGVVIDPDTGTPYTKKQYDQMKRGMRKEKVGKFSGKAAGALGVATMVAGAMGAPPQVTAALGTASTVASMAPMLAGLTGPQGIVVALGAAAVGLYMWNRHLKASDAAQAKYVLSISATTDKMQKIGEINGKVGASQLAQKNRSLGLFNDYNDTNRAGTSYGNNFLTNDAGKNMSQSFIDNMKKVGAPEAAKAVSLELASYISDGVMTAEQANSIAQAIGNKLGNATYTANIQGQLRMLVGPNGEDILKDPIKARMNIVDVSANRSNVVMQSMADAKAKGNSGRNEAAQLAAYDQNTVAIAQAQAEAVQKMYDDQKRGLEAELAATTNKQKQLEIQGKLSALITQATADEIKMNQLVGQQVDRSLNNFKNVVQPGGTGQEDAYFNSLKSQVKDKYANTEYKTMSEDVLSRTAKVSDDHTKQGFKTFKEGQAFEVRMDLMMANGQLNPGQAKAMLDMFDGNLKALDTVLDIGVKTHGAAKIADLQGMLSVGKNKTQTQQIMLTVSKRQPADFDKFSKALASMQALDGNEINMQVAVDTLGQKGLDKLAKDLDAIEKIDTPITKEVIAKFVSDHKDMPGMTASGMDALTSQWKEWDKLPDAIKKEAMSKYQTIYETTFKDEAARLKFMDDYAKKKANEASNNGKNNQLYTNTYTTVYQSLVKGGAAGVAELAAAEGSHTYIGDKPTLSSLDGNSKNGGGTGNRDTTFDDINRRLRDFRNNAISAQGGYNELLKALASKGPKAVLDQFKGINEQLRALGSNQQFIDFISGLDPAQLSKFGTTAKKAGSIKYKDPTTGKTVTQKYAAGDFVLTQKGYNTQKGLEQAISGEYNDTQQKEIQIEKDKVAARARLLKMGMDMVTVEQTIADENMANLVANNKISDAQIKINAALKQQAELRKLAAQLNDPMSAGSNIMAAAKAAMDILDSKKQANEHLIAGEQGHNFAQLTTMIDEEGARAKVLQDQINQTQSRIQDLQYAVDKANRDVETNYTRPIDAFNKKIAAIQRNIEMQFTRPIQSLQDESSVLSHDLDVMNHSAEAINKKYDDQVTALNEVQKINDQIINQQKQQLGLADALSQGDISAAAKAVQEMRGSNAAAYGQSMQDAIAKARENEINNLKGGVSGLTKDQIAEKQYQNNQKIYDLGLEQAKLEKEILGYQDQVYTLEQAKQTALDAIQKQTDAIAAIQNGELLTQEKSLKVINDKILTYQLEQDKLAIVLDTMDKQATVQGRTRSEWEAAYAAADAQDKLLKGEMAKSLAATANAVGAINGGWGSVSSTMDAVIAKAKEYAALLTMNNLATGGTKGTALSAVDFSNAASPIIDAAAKQVAGIKNIDTLAGSNAADAIAQKAITALTVANNGVQLTGQEVVSSRKAILGYLNTGGLVPQYFAAGGYARGADTIPAMLTPGEFIMSKYAVNTHGVDTLRAINSGAELGDSVYNYNLNVNVKSDANPDEIARTIMSQIKQIDSQRIRGNRL